MQKTHQCIKLAQSKPGSKVFVQNYKNPTKLRFEKSQYQICYPINRIHPSKSKIFSRDDLGSFAPRILLSQIYSLFDVQYPGLKRRWRTKITNVRDDYSLSHQSPLKLNEVVCEHLVKLQDMFSFQSPPRKYQAEHRFVEKKILQYWKSNSLLSRDLRVCPESEMWGGAASAE